MARGRSRGFDREQALSQAMLPFWERGYGGASYEALLPAMAIPHPQSPIAALGLKVALLEEALGMYRERHLRPVLACLDANDPVAARWPARWPASAGHFPPALSSDPLRPAAR